MEIFFAGFHIAMSTENKSCLVPLVSENEPAKKSSHACERNNTITDSNYPSQISCIDNDTEPEAGFLSSSSEYESCSSSGPQSMSESFKSTLVTSFDVRTSQISKDGYQKESNLLSKSKTCNTTASVSPIAKESVKQCIDESRFETISNESQAPLVCGNEVVDECLDNDHMQIQISRQKSTDRCKKCIYYANKCRKCYSICIHIFLTILSIFSICIGLSNWSQCNFSKTCLYLFLKGVIILVGIFFRLQYFFSKQFNKYRCYITFDILTRIAVFGVLVAICLELSTLPSVENYGSCNFFFYCTRYINIAILAITILTFLVYLDVFYVCTCQNTEI